MSQARMCKAVKVPNGKKGSNICASILKAATEEHPHRETQRSRNKYKIPKNVRYDLENALVGLCDVWFEEIKPHLVRNNIKLHVHDPRGGAGCASGDYNRHQPPAAAPSCSHLDPASTARKCKLCRLLFNAANSIESAVSQAAGSQSSASSSTAVTANDSTRLHSGSSSQKSSSCEETRARPSTGTTRTHRRKPTYQSQCRPNWRVPRLCRTLSVILSPRETGPSPQLTPKSPNCNPQPIYDESCVPELISLLNKDGKLPDQPKVKMKTKSTQTDITVSPNQPGFPGLPTYSPLLAPSRSLYRRPPSNFVPRQHQLPSTKESVLFPNDLIDIIGEKNDKRLRVIYNNPDQVEDSSITNFVSLYDRRKKARVPKKNPPWR